MNDTTIIKLFLLGIIFMNAFIAGILLALLKLIVSSGILG